MQMGFGYADDDTPVPLGPGACVYYFNSRCRGLGMNPEPESTNPFFFFFFLLRRQNRGGDVNTERVGEKKKTPPHSNLSKQI